MNLQVREIIGLLNIMKCLECKNTKNFIVLGNQNFKVEFKDGHLRKITRDDFGISDIYPVVCGKCRSEDIDFKYWEMEEMLTKAKKFKVSNEV